MRKLLAILLISFPFNLFGESQERVDFEITSRISAVGGDGDQRIFVETNQHEKFLIFLYPRRWGSVSERQYDLCEKYLLMKMEKGFSKVRILNVFELKQTAERLQVSLDEHSYCMVYN